MDLIATKSEASLRRRNSFSGGSDASSAVVKRRRRCPSMLALNDHKSSGAKENQLPAPTTPLLDHSNGVVTTATTTPTTPTTVKRSSKFRGVSRHRWTGRYEAHLWDKGSWNATQKKKGKQVYLGAYDEEESAARAYDLAAIKYWGTTTFTNFPVTDYEKELEIMENTTKEEYLATLRRRSSGFSRGVSKYRGVARHHHNGRWEARIGRVFGNKYLYLGTYSTQEEAAHAYDIAAIEYRGINAVTNFDLSTYIRWLRSGSNSAAATSQSQDQTLPPAITAPHHVVEEPRFPFGSSSLQLGINNASQDQQLLDTKTLMADTDSSSSAPSALSLLLRSSMFKELVEKNLNAGNDEEQETKVVMKSEGNEFRGMFFNGMCPSKVGMELNEDEDEDEKNELPLFRNPNQSLWNGSRNINKSSRH
ncbi:AP2-like ethylene-responsive transcription factor At1g16060 [Cynara cardunculus var. scolymus]|uniref:AP2-like ethylene-responsive transcription factor At1g16060 n=1 Tax=Cynara cardunculus var. scolymus TaxID=59895 RepID=UPI000D626D2F|nr:AP2-like ethylene-responsive transcription factor At1g16060 [Cynara cardunculus var. scolymus]